jgi:lysophospholipase L1-like esterase
MKKRILCYGDSNTWGANATDHARYDDDVRWTGVLANGLGASYTIIEEGLGGRTTVHEDPTDPYRNGRDYLFPCLRSHRPLDLVVLMLGTNDLKTRFAISAWDIADGMRALGEIILASDAGRNNKAPVLLMMSPPPLVKTNLLPHFAGMVEKSKELATCYAAVAKQLGCHYFDVGKVIKTSKLDGVHWDASEHLVLGKKLTQVIGKLL